jgi:hypothetical protein
VTAGAEETTTCLESHGRIQDGVARFAREVETRTAKGDDDIVTLFPIEPVLPLARSPAVRFALS